MSRIRFTLGGADAPFAGLALRARALALHEGWGLLCGLLMLAFLVGGL